MDAPDASRLASRRWPRLGHWAGPLLIVGAVLFALRGFAFQAALTNQHPDLLTFWLPRWSFLGDSIAAGRIPLWNPFEMAGYRFAADPQSGWLYAPPMLLFSLLPPGLALRLFIVLNPLLGGLATYGFLRKESASRPAATVGGLVLAMMVSTSTIAISLPFAGAIAWTAVLLLAAAGYRWTERWSARLGWLALGAFAWFQVAAAHLSHGLVIATGFAAVVIVAGAVADARAGRASGRAAAARAALFLVALPIAALPILVPHVDAIADSSLRGGYGALGDPGQSEVGDPLGSRGVWAAWPLGFAAAPGAYAGAAAMSAAVLAARARRLRSIVLPIGALALAAYVLTSSLLVGAGWFRSFVVALPFGDVYLHNPGRLRYVFVIALPILAAAGVQALVDRAISSRAAIGWLAGSAALFVALPIAAGGHPVRFAMAAAAFALAAPVWFAVATRRWTWATVPVLVGALTVELLASAAYSQTYEGGTIFTGLETGEHPILAPQVLRFPELDETAYLRPTPVVAYLRANPGRYATWAPPASSYEKGYLWMKSPEDWPALAPSRGTLFGVPDALGYNPVQLPRYWRFIRATNDLSVFYNASVLNVPSPEDVRLLGLRYLLVPDGIDPPVAGRVVEAADGYSLWELSNGQPEATGTDRVEHASGVRDALRLVTETRFDPAAVAVVEDPDVLGAADAGATWDVEIVERSPTLLRLRLPAGSAGVLTVRSAYDPGWGATIDGREVRTFPVDGFLQGVLVRGPSTNKVRLVYRDDDVMVGLALGAGIWGVLVAGPLVAFALERRGTRRDAAGGA